MKFEISCSIFKKIRKSFNFNFFKTVIFRYFWFWLKHPKLSICLCLIETNFALFQRKNTLVIQNPFWPDPPSFPRLAKSLFANPSPPPFSARHNLWTAPKIPNLWQNIFSQPLKNLYRHFFLFVTQLMQFLLKSFWFCF